MVAIVLLVLVLLFLGFAWWVGLQRAIDWLQVAGRWARYAYFLRFSLMLWLFAPALCLANHLDQTLTSGIVAPDLLRQYVCVGFFLVSSGFSALILARIVLINGPERWDQGYNNQNDARPPLLVTLFDNPAGEHELAALLLTQIPNACVFFYMVVYGREQNLSPYKTLLGLLLGAALAFFFWILANAFYYLTFVAAPLAVQVTKFELGQTAARTLLFPRFFFRLNKIRSDLPGRPSIEGARTCVPHFKVNAGPWTVVMQGYGQVDKKQFYFYEAHYFATIVLAAFLILYLLIWPLAAPVPAPILSWVAIGLLCLIALLTLFIFWTAKSDRQGNLTATQLLLTFGVSVLLGAVIWLYASGSPDRFPIFATLLIMVTLLAWGLGAIGFFFDRYRVPVLTSILVAMILPRALHLDRSLQWNSDHHLYSRSSQEEHYLSTDWSNSNDVPPTPATILADRFAPGDPKPLIIVTSTGGGLHAAAWTAAVLSHLEADTSGDFHRHLLLMSTVSGGSVGLLTYLRELHEGTLDNDPAFAAMRMKSASQCSSLESVGWGLVYYDMPKTFIPFFPYFISPSSGEGDLDTGIHHGTPLGKDRTWSLRKSFGRNLDNDYCDRLWAADTQADPDWNTPLKNSPGGRGLTLRQLPPGTANGVLIPAFTMNTTSVEDGHRFLLANYDVPDLKLDSGQNYRARSFLGTYRSGAAHYPDLPLATAAQMSATFPYVSSAARVPLAVDDFINDMHFVDGGYYDNDGTVSTIEFLRYALAPSGVKGHEDEDTAGIGEMSSKLASSKFPVRVLLIEIRNSEDDHGTGPEEQGNHNGNTTPWNALSQLTAPLEGFWQAGHGSVTARNRAALGLLEHELSGKLEVHRVIFADAQTQQATGTDPLSWSLTPRQRDEVRTTSTKDPAILKKYEDAKDWLARTPQQWCGNGDSEDPVAECLKAAKNQPSKH